MTQVGRHYLPQGHRGIPPRLWSLWDLMNLFDAKSILKRVGELASVEFALREAESKEAKMRQSYITALEKAVIALAPTGMTDATKTLEHLRKYAQTQPRAAIVADANTARFAVINEFDKRKFLFVRPERAEYVDQERLFGDEVYNNFPSARTDIKEAGNCLACECGTAAVFHLMRAVEWALRAFCTSLGVKRLRCKNRKTGKVTYKPVEFSEWEGILTDAEGRINGMLKPLTRGSRKQMLQEFYLPAVQDFKGFRDAFRNHVMHTRRDYTPQEADAIRDRVQRFMTALAKRSLVEV